MIAAVLVGAAFAAGWFAVDFPARVVAELLGELGEDPYQ